MVMQVEIDRTILTAEEKKRELFIRQKELLVTKAQYDKSLCDLRNLMGFDDL